MDNFKYDESKDKIIKNKEVYLSEHSGVDLIMYSYDGGNFKLQQSMFYIDRDGKKGYKKFGRLKVDQACTLALEIIEFLK